MDGDMEVASQVEKHYAPESHGMSDALTKVWRVLTFRATEQELVLLNRHDLIVGLLFTWLVGVGRYWDNGRAEFLQVLGVGSVLYVFALALFLWLILWPMRPANWTYFRVLTYVTLTAPPALLYAIPFQMMFPDPDYAVANTLNAWLLALVAAWRVALLWRFLKVLARLSTFDVILSTFLPLLLIIVALAALNLEHAVFTIMGGITNPSPNDVAYEILMLITFMSYLAFLPVAIMYISAIVGRRRARQRQQAEVEVSAPGEPAAKQI